jgi:hypothetical protein
MRKINIIPRTAPNQSDGNTETKPCIRTHITLPNSRNSSKLKTSPKAVRFSLLTTGHTSGDSLGYALGSGLDAHELHRAP